MKDATARSRPRLSIVTVFWNSADDLEPFFGAIERAAAALPFSIEIVAIDNASSDGTPDLVANRASSVPVRLIRNDGNAGFAAACNQGLEQARGEFLLLLNPDCEAGAEALAGMVRLLERHPRIGVAGCRLLHEDGLPQHSWHAEPSALSYWATHSLVSPLCLRVRKLLHRYERRPRPFHTGWLMGACMMTRRDAYRDVGGLDPEYFMYSEDMDWCRRMRDAGLHVVHDPRVSLVHRHGTSAWRLPEFAFRRLYRSLLMYTKKHHGPLRNISLRAAVVLDMCLRLPVYVATGNARRIESVRAVVGIFLSNRPEALPIEAPTGTGS